MTHDCKRCGGWGDIRSQCNGGEVRHYKCERCDGTGDEPLFGFLLPIAPIYVDEAHEYTPYLFTRSVARRIQHALS